MNAESSSWGNWVIAIVVIAAIIGLLIFARGPTDQRRSGVVEPVAVSTIHS